MYERQGVNSVLATAAGGRTGRWEMEPSVVYKKFVMVGDLNAAGTLYGGTMMSWVDEAASVYAAELLGPGVGFVTLKISEVLFKHPAVLGDLLTFYARLQRVGRTSLDVSVEVHNREREVVTCEVRFVTVDHVHRRPVPHRLPPMAAPT
jgi:acyl-CoA thioesterase YciA